MYPKTLTILISALCSIQVHCKVVPFDLVDDAKALLEELRQTTKDARNEVFDDYTLLSIRLDSAATTTKENSLIQIKKITEDYISQVSTIKDSAKSAGADISGCLGPENQINQLEETNAQELIACVNGQANTSISSIYGQGARLADYLWNLLEAEDTQLVFCGATDEKCINVVIEDIRKSIEQVAVIYNNVYGIDSKGLETLIPFINFCGSKSISKAQADGSSMTEYIQNCADDIMGNKR